jgi:hypothetical protein
VLRKSLIGLVLLLTIAPAAAAAPELSVSDRLQDRRYGVAGERARAIGFQDGRWYANGWHITGEMGGVWSEPLKLVDGVWFGIDDQWVGRARRFTSGWGYAKLDLPPASGLRLERVDFAPDDKRAALFGLRMTNPAQGSRTVTVKVDAHSELMTEYPWAFSTVPNAADNRPDTAAFDGGRARLQGRRLCGAGGFQHGPGGGRDRPIAERVPRAAGLERLPGPGAAERLR